MVDASMNRKISKTIGRWLVAIVVCAASLVAAFVVLELTVVLVPRTGIRWADALHIHLPANIFVSFLSLAAVAAAFAVWTIPCAFAVGYALRMPALSRLRWGFTACLLLTAVFRWYAPSAASTFKPHIFILVAWAVLVGGVVLSFRRGHGSKSTLFRKRRGIGAVNTALLDCSGHLPTATAHGVQTLVGDASRDLLARTEYHGFL